jgi:hypothetical protein
MHKRTGDTLADVAGYPTGKYTIELCDDRGKVKERIESENYISTLWDNYAKTNSLLELGTYGFPYSSGTSIDYGSFSGMTPWPGRIVHPLAHRPWPFQSLVLTGDTTAESSSVHWLKGQMLGYATLWKATVPASGPRGQINEAECTRTTNAGVWKWVWDFGTQQGNGVIQTAAIGAVSPSKLSYFAMVGPHAVAGPPISELASSTGTMTMYIGNGKIFMWALDGTGSPQNFRCYQANIPGGLYSTDLDGSGKILDASSITWTQVGTTNPGGIARDATGGGAGMWVATGTSESGGTVGMHYDATTGDMFVAVPFTNGSGNAFRSNLSGTAAWTTTLFGGSGYATVGGSNSSVNYNGDIAVVGTKCYVTMAGNAANAVTKTKLLRLDVATGAIDATITLPAGITSEGTITTDGTDLFLASNIGIIKLSTAGALLQVYGYPIAWVALNFENETASAPWSTSANDRGFYSGLEGNLTYQGASTAFLAKGASSGTNNLSPSAYVYRRALYQTTSINTILNVNNLYQKLQYHNSRLWINGKLAIFNNGRPSHLGITGGNCFSRTLLPSTVTKTTSNTMKVSYELTFPSWDSLWHSHLSP